MTTERIDVLAVMDEMIDCYGSVEECPDDTEFLVAARGARAAVAEVVAKKNDAYFAWQMLAAICDTDPSTDRIKARDAAWNVYSALARVSGD